MEASEITITDFDGNEVIVPLTQQLIKKVLAAARKGGLAEKRFDLNLVEGQLAETQLLHLIGNSSSVEVKRDFAASKTGNIAVEFMCGGKPSGISTTQAEWWTYSLAGDQYNDEVIILIKKKRLERLLLPSRIKRGGDNHKAEMYLVRVEELVKGLKGESN